MVLAVSAHASDSMKSKLTDAMRRQMIERVLEDAAGRTEGRFILGNVRSQTVSLQPS